MAKFNTLADLTEALSAPLGDLIASVGQGVAEAQQRLDLHTIETIKTVYASDKQAYEEFRQLGYQPTWYKIPEVTAEISVAISVSGNVRQRMENGGDQANARAGGIKLYAAPVDATYTNQYNYNLQATSRVKFRIVPVPPTSQAEGMKVIPDLTGRTYGEAQALLEQLDIPYQIAQENLEPPDTDLIDRSEPEAGAILPKGQPLKLWIAL